MFLAIDVNDKNNYDILRTYKLRYTPTSIIIDENGQISSNHVGLLSAEELKKELNKVIK